MLAMRCFKHKKVRLLLALSPSLYAPSSSAFVLLLKPKPKPKQHTTLTLSSDSSFPNHNTRIVSSSLPAVAGGGTTGRDRRISSTSSSSLMDETSCSSSNDEQQNQKQRQGQGQGQQQNIDDTKLIANDEELARQRRIGQMNQRVQKAVSAEDRIYVLEAKAKLANQESSSSNNVVGEDVVVADNNNNNSTDMMMTRAEYAELNGLLKMRSVYEEQYDPNKFTKEHIEFKDMHNDAFIHLARYCERERIKIRNAIRNNEKQQSSPSPQSPITTNLFFLDGPDGGTTSALLERGKFNSNQCYVANRHESSCDLLRISGGGLLPDENVVHATSSEALTSQSTTTNSNTDFSSLIINTPEEGEQQQQGSFAHIDFTAYYFDGCGGYVPHVINMLSSALLSQHQQEEKDDNDDDNDNDHNNNNDFMNTGPIAVGYSLLGGSKNVIEKELYITYYLKAAALLLNALERQRVNSRPANYSILTMSYSGTSPNLSAMICSSTSFAVLSLLFNLLFPSFTYICVISGVLLYLTVFIIVALLEDLFFCIRLYTLVRGLSDILFIFMCFVRFNFLETFVFAGLFAVKCCHIGLLLSFASSLTLFML